MQSQLINQEKNIFIGFSLNHQHKKAPAFRITQKRHSLHKITIHDCQ